MRAITISNIASPSFAALLAAATPLAAQPEAATFETSAGSVLVEPVAGPFEHPWALAFLPDGGMLVTERSGRLLVLGDTANFAVAGVPEVLDEGQGGMLDVALAADFDETHRIFVTYSEPVEGGRGRTAVASGVLALDGPPRLNDVEVIFRQDPPVDSGRHYGSRIVVTPEGDLFVTLGERGRRPMAQELDNHLGKIVLISADGEITERSPAIDVEGAAPEIWSYGHRNPQGAALDPETGALWVVEHGARGGDELNQPRQGGNYGWPEISYGTHYSGASFPQGDAAPGMEQPVHYWDPSIAPSGLTFYDGGLFPEWSGDVFVGALKFRLITRLDMENGQVVGEERLFEDAFGRVRDVRTGPDGALWFLTDEPEAWLYRVSPAG